MARIASSSSVAAGSAAPRCTGSPPNSGPGCSGSSNSGLGHYRGASQDHSRIIRLAQHQPQYAALAPAAYKAWDEVEKRIGPADRHPAPAGWSIEDAAHRGGRPRRHPQHRGLRSSCSTGSASTTSSSTQTRWPPAGRSSGLDGGEQALYQARVTGSSTPPARTPCTSRWPAPTARTSGEHAGAGGPARRRRRRGGHTDEHAYRADRVVVASDAWTNQVLADCGVRLPLTVTAGAGHLLRHSAPGRVRAGELPGVHVARPAQFLRLSRLRRGGDQARPAHGRARGYTAETRTFEPDPQRHRRYRAVPGSPTSPGSPARNCTRRPACTPSRRIRTSCSAPSPRTRESSSPSAPDTPTSSPR